ncbi:MULTISPECIES: hypothetical protein [unclassified Streptomyces]|uniref:hypothetical protein n=1 Tax=unclassified Streptomyces TaxID=2593676 RepID=UPI00381B6F59
MPNETTAVRVHPDYDCFPTWLHHGDDSDNVAPDTLPVSDGLARDLAAWGAEFDATLDRDNPVDSGFHTEADEQDFAARGEGLARRLQEELGAGVPVVYYDIRKSERVPMGPPASE